MMIAPPPPAAASAPTSAQVSLVRYGVASSELGETLEAWRSAKPSRGALACRLDAKRPSLTVCPGGDAPLGGGFFARDLTYSFLDGRLARISYRSSIDAFDFVTADLKHRFGLPDQIVRDRIRDSKRSSRFHVMMEWRNGHSTITLNDPVPNATKLSVSFTMDAAEKRLAYVG